MWNGTMFVDLDWPLNASSLLSASAELLVWSWKSHGKSWKINVEKEGAPRFWCPYLCGLSVGSACALVSPMWAYIIAAWWPEGCIWTITYLLQSPNNFVLLSAGSLTLEIRTSDKTHGKLNWFSNQSPDNRWSSHDVMVKASKVD